MPDTKCPARESPQKPSSGFLSAISAPALRALKREGIVNLANLAERSEKELLRLHGIGPSTIPRLKKALEENGLRLKG